MIGRHEDLAQRSLEARRANWLCDQVPNERTRCSAQIRYNSQAQAAELIPIDETRFRVQFDEACFGVAPGQAVVCYDQDRVIGGGWIV